MSTKTTKTIKLNDKAYGLFDQIKAAGAAGIDTASTKIDGRTMRTLTKYKLVAGAGASKVRLSKTGSTAVVEQIQKAA